MQCAIVTDTHLGARNNCTIVNTHFLEFFSELFFPTLERYNIRNVFHLGDLGEYKRSVNTLILDSWNQQVFKKLQDYSVWMLCGNHDLFYKNNNSVSLQSSLELADRFGFAVVQDKLVTVEDIDLIPWLSTSNYTTILAQVENSISNYLFGHLEVTGALMTPGIFCTESQLDLNLLSKYRRVLSGHFHLRSTVSNVTYIGNPYQIIWSDANQLKGFVLFDTEKNVLQYINNPKSLFSKLFINTEEDIEQVDPTHYKTKHVKIFVNYSVSQQKVFNLVTLLEKYSPLSVIVQESRPDITEITQNSEYQDTFFYVREYVDSLYSQNKIGLDKQRLINKLDTIYNRAQTRVI